MATAYTLEFEKPLLELEREIDDLKRVGSERDIDISQDLEQLDTKLVALREHIYQHLTPIQRVQVARHPRRPYTLDYLSTIFTDFIELHGDRHFRDDPSIVGGWARIGGMSVMVIGHQKGRDTKENLKRNFGMPHPEGYRKALRLMHQAAKFSAPVVTLIDTPGAYPGLGAEERGQSEALARNILEMAALPTQIVAVVIGEEQEPSPASTSSGRTSSRGFLATRAICCSSTMVKALMWIEGRASFTARMRSR